MSSYLVENARQHIEGHISIDEVRRNLNEYYQTKNAHDNEDSDQAEADKVASNIVKLLGEDTFAFSYAGLLNIHRRVFDGVFKFAGKIRDYNISKKEWVLDGDSVLYVSATELRRAVEYDLSVEKEKDYTSMDFDSAISSLADFISGLWQIHPFGEGNTRTTAVFLIKYLRSLGFHVTNDLFAEKSWYFRNALVRANYSNVPKSIPKYRSFLISFFRNLLLDETTPLHNRDMHVSKTKTQRASTEISKGQFGTLNGTLEELAVLKVIEQNTRITQKEIAAAISKSERTVKRITSSLGEKGILIRRNGKRNGYWEIIKPS